MARVEACESRQNGAGFVGAFIELLAQQSTHKPLIHKRKQEEVVTKISRIDRCIPQELRDTLS